MLYFRPLNEHHQQIPREMTDCTVESIDMHLVVDRLTGLRLPRLGGVDLVMLSLLSLNVLKQFFVPTALFMAEGRLLMEL
jgi:hypothetical protein